MTLWGVVAGGRGTRFGEPKISALVGADTFLERCLGVIDKARRPDDVVAVGVARDQQIVVVPEVAVVRDLEVSPGPAHSIVRLAEHAMSLRQDLVFMAVDLLAVEPSTLGAIAARIESNRVNAVDAVVVAKTSERVHWVLGGIPREQLEPIVSAGESVNAVQSLLRMCRLDYLEVDPTQLLDVNTRDLLSAVPPIASNSRPE